MPPYPPDDADEESTDASQMEHVTAVLDPARHMSHANYLYIRPFSDFNEVYEKLDQQLGTGGVGDVFVVRKRKDGNLSLRNLSTVPESEHQHADIATRESNAVLAPHVLHGYPVVVKKERLFACKTVSTENMSEDQLSQFENEIELLRDLDHPNILQLYECFRDRRKLLLVMELCQGGDLSDRRIDSEFNIMKVIDQLLHGLAYLHARDICHRDLKLENVMFETKEVTSNIKLIDFGLSVRSGTQSVMEKQCGTIYTSCPEVLCEEKAYSAKSDMWSVGCMLFVLISGDVPFMEDMADLNNVNKVSNLASGKFTLEGIRWSMATDESKDFIKNCFKVNPAERWSASEAITFIAAKWSRKFDKEGNLRLFPSPTMRGLASRTSGTGGGIALPGSKGFSLSGAPPASPGGTALNYSLGNNSGSGVSATPPRPPMRRLGSNIIRSFEKFAGYGKMKRKIFMTMAYTMDKSELGELSKLFVEMDADGSGTITYAELKEALLNSGSSAASKMTELTVKDLFESLDYDHSGEIRYMEFIASIIESQGLVTRERLVEAFDRMDSDNKGYISKQNLLDMFGVEANAEMVDEMIKEAGGSSEGVYLDAFLRLATSGMSSGRVRQLTGGTPGATSGFFDAVPPTPPRGATSDAP